MVGFSIVEIDFVAWVQAELDQRNWKPADLMRQGHISDSQVSRVMNQERSPGRDFLEGVARAFKMPLERVFVMAGWLPDYGEIIPEAKAWSARLTALSAVNRSNAIRAMEAALAAIEGAAQPVRR